MIYKWDLKLPALFLLAVFFITGCAVLPAAREREMGRREAERLEEEVGLYHSDEYRSYVQNVGNRLAIYTERKYLDYEFEILDTFLVNALALPGGYVYITRGLLKELETEAELAGVLGHELGHINARHAEKRRQIQMATVLAGLAAAPATGGRSLVGGLVGGDMAARGYTREAEYEADELGLKYMISAGYDPAGLTDSLRRLQEISGEIPDYELLILRTHPYLVDRIRRIDMQQLTRRYAEDDEPLIVNRSRYQRLRRRHLYREDEAALLSRLDKFLEEYKARRISALEEFLHDNFEFEHQDGTGLQAFRELLENKFENLEKIEYTYRLQRLEVEEGEATVVYSFKEEKFHRDDEFPQVNSGYQKMQWQKVDEEWKLTKLR